MSMATSAAMLDGCASEVTARVMPTNVVAILESWLTDSCCFFTMPKVPFSMTDNRLGDDIDKVTSFSPILTT